ncbi:MAG: hypothetical protein M1840_004273 [Geoglossum simile]|nr:MAG: hypothetical protein M1840_004273 [Geoglossum simile]
MSRTTPTRLKICLRCQLHPGRSAPSTQPVATPLQSKWFTSSGLLARTTTQPTFEQTADRDLEKWEPPKERRWGSPNKPIGRLRGHKSRHMLESVANLQTEALGEPAQVIILRDPKLDDPRPLVNTNTTDRETPNTENPTLIELLAKLEAERGIISQEDVNANIEALHLSPATVLSQDGFSKLADELCKGFTTAQLTGYIHAFEAKQPPRHSTEKMKRPANLEEAEWTPVLVPRPNPPVDMSVTSTSVRNLTKKRKLAERVLRRCWNVQTEEEYESMGQIELYLGHRELSLLLRERNSLMQRFSETYNCQVGVSRSRRIVQVTGRRYDAQNLVLALKETVKSIACAEFDIAPLLSLREGASRVDVIEESIMEAISRSTDTEIERALDRNKVNIYYWNWKTANLEKARRLLLAQLELPNYSKSAVFTDTGSAAGSLALCRTDPGTELPLNERVIQWSRCRFGLAKANEITQLDRDLADDIRPTEVSKNIVTTSMSTMKRMWAFLQPVELENTAYSSHNDGAITGKGEATTRLQPISVQTVQHSGKAENPGLPARWSAHPASIVSVKLGQIVHNTTGLPPVHPMQLRGLLSKDTKNRSFLSGFSGMPNLLRIMQPLEAVSRQYLSMRLIPSPWMSSGLESIAGFPHVEISTLISEDTGEPQLPVVQAVVEENIADLMLPNMHADLRFSRRTNFTLLSPLLDRKVKEFVKSGELQVDGVRPPGAPPYVELQVPRRLTRGISATELELADDAGEQGVLVQYNLVGLGVQHRVQFDYHGWRVTYSDTNSGKVRGRRKELLMTMARNTPGVDKYPISELPPDFPAFFGDARRLITEIEDLSPKCPPTVSANSGVTEPVQPGGVLLGTAET